MATICILTTAHRPLDDRVFYREAVSLATHGGHHVILIAPGDGTQMNRNGVEIITIRQPSNRLERFTLTVLRVVRAALRTKADIYHFHDPDLLPWMAVLALTGRKIVYDVHEYYRYSIQTAGWLPPIFRKTVAAIVDWMEKKANKTFSGTITVSPHMERLFSATAKNTVTISNYPLPWFIEQTRPTDEGPLPGTIIYIGHINKVRGYTQILDAMKIIHETHPEFICKIIGWPDYSEIDTSLPRLEDKRTEELGIRFTPVAPFADMPLHLKQASVCWLPWQRTMNNELGTPIKLFEYMSSGRPLVCSEMGIISAVVKETGCGLLVPPDDPQAHACALIHLLTHPDEAAQMGARGRKWVIARYNWLEEEKKLLTFYERLTQEEVRDGNGL